MTVFPLVSFSSWEISLWVSAVAGAAWASGVLISFYMISASGILEENDPFKSPGFHIKGLFEEIISRIQKPYNCMTSPEGKLEA